MVITESLNKYLISSVEELVKKTEIAEAIIT
jgi:hypothetical protein